jgi:hypothetical protein
MFIIGKKIFFFYFILTTVNFIFASNEKKMWESIQRKSIQRKSIIYKKITKIKEFQKNCNSFIRASNFKCFNVGYVYINGERIKKSWVQTNFLQNNQMNN